MAGPPLGAATIASISARKSPTACHRRFGFFSFSFFFVFIFAKGYEGRGLAEGFRYGIYIALFYYYVTCFNQFVLYPIPYSLTWIRVIAGLVQAIILGIVAAAIYKPKRSAVVAAAG